MRRSGLVFDLQEQSAGLSASPNVFLQIGLPFGMVSRSGDNLCARNELSIARSVGFARCRSKKLQSHGKILQSVHLDVARVCAADLWSAIKLARVCFVYVSDANAQLFRLMKVDPVDALVAREVEIQSAI
jgi:hypothetical protein